MKISNWKMAFVLLGAMGTVLPQQVMAEQPTAKTQTAKQAVLDVTLSKSGSLSGYVVDAQGKPQANQAVTVKQGKETVAKAQTNAKGQFTVEGLKGGVYQVESAKGATLYRAWASGSAPKNSKDFAVVVQNNQLVRGQFEVLGLGGLGSVATVGVLATSVTLGTIGLVNANDAQDDADAANARANDLQMQIDQITNTP